MTQNLYVPLSLSLHDVSFIVHNGKQNNTSSLQLNNKAAVLY